MMDFDDEGFGLGGRSGLGGAFAGAGARATAAQPAFKVPVSILCGFLGAGKTTVVQHILRNREGMKVGVVVNDVAEANVDSEVLKIDDADGIVGLQNGCACCSGRDDLFARLQELVESTGNSKLDRCWDRLVVECSGVAEPESIARELEAMGQRREAVMQRIFLAGIVCVVDASTFWGTYYSQQKAPESGRPLAELLLSQLECADTVVISKVDLVDEQALGRLQELLKSLSPNARRLTAVKGALPLRTLLPAGPIDLEMPAYVPSLANRHSVAVRAAGIAAESPPAPVCGPCEEEPACGHHHHRVDGKDCSHCHSARHAARHARYGLSSFVYRCGDRLFSPAGLAALARQLPVAAAELEGLFGAPAGEVKPSPAFAGVLRSKGFVRVSGCEAPLYWSHAGLRVQLSPVPSISGPRGQELVFIGAGMDQGAITRCVDAALEVEGARL